MKKIFIFSLLALSLVACKDNKGENTEGEEPAAEQTEMSDGAEYEKNGVYSIYREPMTADSDDNTYHVAIYITPDPSLPTVENASFNRTYADNRANVTVTADNDTILSRQFTKQSFAEYFDANINKKAILNRITCRGFSANGVKLEAEISVPHSDEECYVTITVLRDGTVTMERYTDTEVPEEIATNNM